MDKLFLLTPDFHDPAYPNRKFYCCHCVLVEGLLKTFPRLEAQLEVVRVEWPRPRQQVVAEAGEENQSLPLLVLSEGKTSRHQNATWKGRALINDKDSILRYLADEYGIGEPHP